MQGFRDYSSGVTVQGLEFRIGFSVQVQGAGFGV
jgi:hypothetical protein